MKKDKIIIIGVGSENEAVRIASKKLEDMGHEVVFVDSYKDTLVHVESDINEERSMGTTVSGHEIVKALEDIQRANKPRPLSETLKEDPNPFILHNHRPLEPLKPYVHEENHGPIGAILGNKKRRRK